MALTPIRVAFYNLGVQDSRLEGKSRETWLQRLRSDEGHLWSLHDLDGLWLCEVGDHRTGLCEMSAVTDVIKAAITKQCISSGATEPTLVVQALASYVQVYDAKRLEVLQEAWLAEVDAKRHCMAVIL